MEELRRSARSTLESGDGSAAAALLTLAASLDPTSMSLRLELANALLFAGRDLEALAQYDLVLARQPARAETQSARADVLLDLGRREDAAEGYRKALALRSEFRHPAHMLAMLGDTKEGENEDYVAGLFDGYAEQFDHHLVGDLDYRVPTAMREALTKHIGARGQLATLDLGCGTGLLADALRRLAAPIDGIDLSAQMVEVARRKGLYRTLAVGDIGALAGTESFTGPYDLVTAGDVLSYIRELRGVFAAVRRVLAPGGLFAFTIEDAGDGDAVLRSSGRFTHGAAHVRDIGIDNRLTVTDELALTLRTERLRPVSGRLFILTA